MDVIREIDRMARCVLMAGILIGFGVGLGVGALVGALLL